MLSGLLLGLILLLRGWPSAPVVRALHKVIVEIPAAWLARAERRHIIIILVVAAMLIASGEILAVFGSFDAFLVFSIDLSIYLDAVGAVIAIAAASRLKTTYQFVKARLTSTRAQPIRSTERRSAREVRSRPVRQVANDDSKDDRPERQAA